MAFLLQGNTHSEQVKFGLKITEDVKKIKNKYPPLNFSDISESEVTSFPPNEIEKTLKEQDNVMIEKHVFVNRYTLDLRRIFQAVLRIRNFYFGSGIGSGSGL